MGRLRIHGLVGLATKVRRELAGPVSPVRLHRLRQEVSDAVRAVSQILAEHGENLDDLPVPSRKAYQFLAGVDFEAIQPSESPLKEGYALGSVRLSGLRRYVEGLLNKLATANEADLDGIHKRLRRSSENLERELITKGIQPEHLTEESRAYRGWLAYLSQRENLDAYVAAIGRARSALEAALQNSAKYRLPILIHFRPMRGLYRIRGYRDGTLLSLATPMIIFDSNAFAELAKMAVLGSRNNQGMLEKATSDPYQAIRLELEALGGIVEHAAGMFHDLAESFGRVNATYFGSSMSRPRLTWSGTFTGRKFGHYDFVRETVMVSSSLDRADVPAYVVDSIVYHELLHKKLGVRWENGRKAAHTPEFHREEKRFERLAEAEAKLKELAGIQQGSIRQEQTASNLTPQPPSRRFPLRGRCSRDS